MSRPAGAAADALADAPGAADDAADDGVVCVRQAAAPPADMSAGTTAMVRARAHTGRCLVERMRLPPRSPAWKKWSIVVHGAGGAQEACGVRPGGRLRPQGSP